MLATILGLGATALATKGIFDSGKAFFTNIKAENIIDEANKKYNASHEKLENQRLISLKDLETLGKTKVEIWAEDFDDFIEIFKLFKKVDLTGNFSLGEDLEIKIDEPEDIKVMKNLSINAAEILGIGVTAVSAGVLAGIASYSGVSMLASASTGTAIATLSGAAAKNATLAWFGGGSLATGGGGMAAGTLTLGGVVIGPALAVAGHLYKKKAEHNLKEAQNAAIEVDNACQEIDKTIAFLIDMSRVSRDIDSFIKDVTADFQRSIGRLERVYYEAVELQKDCFCNKVRNFFGLQYKVDYQKLDDEQKRTVRKSWCFAQILYSVLSSPILDNDNNMNCEVEQTIHNARNSLWTLKSSEYLFI